MNQIHNERFDYRGAHGDWGHCHLQIYEANNAPYVVIATQVPTNTATSVTNRIAHIASRVEAELLPHHKTRGFIMVEHQLPGRYGGKDDPEEFSIVTFGITAKPSQAILFHGNDVGEEGRFGAPSWKYTKTYRIARLLGQAAGETYWHIAALYDKNSASAQEQRRSCYWISQTQDAEAQGGYFPSVVEEGVAGHNFTDWNWGMDIEKAQRIADKKNAALGLSEEDVMEIVDSSMRAGPVVGNQLTVLNEGDDVGNCK